MSGSGPASRPILFSSPMVRAILAGTKTQTRRLAGLDDVNEHPEWWKQPKLGPLGYKAKESAKGKFGATFFADRPGEILVCPQKAPAAPGDFLWVRETIDAEHVCSGQWRLTYRADRAPVDLSRELPGEARLRYGWSRPFVPSIFMPRWASRLTLEVTAVRVERLHQLSEPDALAEGMEFHDGRGIGHSGYRHDRNHGVVYGTALEAFAVGWDKINGKRGNWESNPFVWVVEFRLALPKEAGEA